MQDQTALGEDWFNANEWISLFVEVHAGTKELTCDQSSSANKNMCKIIPHWSYTPIWYGLSPPVLYPGQETTLIINPMHARTLRFESDFLSSVEMMLDDIRLFRSPFLDSDGAELENLSWNVNYVHGEVINEVRNL